MKTASRVVFASLVAATVLAPLAAAAHDCDGDRDEGREHEHEGRDDGARYLPPPPWEVGPGYAVQPAWAQPGPFDGAWRDGWGRDGRGWVRRGDGPRYVDPQRAARFEEIRSLRWELRRLDGDRAAFVWRWGWNPRKVARYDAWYLPRRADLQDRLDRLTTYAWR